MTTLKNPASLVITEIDKYQVRKLREENARLREKLAQETALRQKYEASLFRP